MTLSIVHLLNRTVQIKRGVFVPDGQGGFSSTLTTVYEVQGRRHAAVGTERIAEREVAGRQDTEVYIIWYFDKGVDIKIRDVLVSDGHMDEVVALMPPSRDDFVKVSAKEVQIGDTN